MGIRKMVGKGGEEDEGFGVFVPPNIEVRHRRVLLKFQSIPFRERRPSGRQTQKT